MFTRSNRGHGDFVTSGFRGAGVQGLQAAGFQVCQKHRPGHFPLVQHKMVEVGTAFVRKRGRVGSAAHHRLSGLPAARGRQKEGALLHHHGREEHQVGPGNVRVGKWLAVHVHHPDFVIIRSHGRDGHQSKRRHEGLASDQRQSMLHAPVSGIEIGINEKQPSMEPAHESPSRVSRVGLPPQVSQGCIQWRWRHPSGTVTLNTRPEVVRLYANPAAVY